MKLKKENAELSAEYAKTLWQSKRYADAIMQYNAKNCTVWWRSIGLLLFRTLLFFCGNYVAADSTFATFVTKQPTSPDGYVWRAKCNSRIDSEMKAVKRIPFLSEVY